METGEKDLRKKETARGKRQFARQCAKLCAMLLCLVLAGCSAAGIPGNKSYYTAKDFGIKTVKSSVDFDKDGTDDYSDFLLGARKDAENHPRYDGSYQKNGWPPDNIGVCADVIWRAFKEAGYDLRAMVDADVKARTGEYPAVDRPDSKIDFRRVKNLKVFFEKYGISLTLDPAETDKWQPGDIVIFGDNKHIGMVSDRRTKDGVTWIIHNAGQKEREEDYLARDSMGITGHYRFDASLVPKDLLKAWSQDW